MKCHICNYKSIKLLNFFGKVPRSHEFKKKNISKNYKFILNQCPKCTVIQLKKTGKNQSFVPKLKWIKNNEPDEHLNDLILYLEKKLNERKKILLISNFDKKIYDILKKKKNKNLKIIDSKKHLKIKGKNPNQFLIQKSILNKDYIKKISSFGKFDIIVSCRVLEHTYNLNLFIKNLESLLKPNGNFIFEIPDSQKSLTQGDISMLWEEHSIYFTKNSFYKAFQILGYKVLKYNKYTYPQEDALVFRIQKYSKEKIKLNEITKKDKRLGKLFVNKCKIKHKKLITFLRNQNKKNKKIAIFGAGHRSVVYFHINKLGSYINYIYDDNENKKNMFFPGTNIRIKPSINISKNRVDCCFLSLNITKEKKIMDKLKKLNDKIIFYSISPDSKYAF